MCFCGLILTGFAERWGAFNINICVLVIHLTQVIFVDLETLGVVYYIFELHDTNEMTVKNVNVSLSRCYARY